ncbi:MAG: glucose-6-phosphate dehydrogenase assembly protein OpcA [Chloroflexi bacterium]|nr:glucose-6-phosphate dehydrogenase assembly protein OpcA [Chloroflexota bacterium]
MAQALDSEGRELSWTGRSVDIDRIEAELTKLRYLTAGDADAGESLAIRTSLANMVVLAEDDETAAQASRVIEDLAAHHPSRALIVIARPSEDESRIDTSLAAHCHLAPGLDQHVCCEEVTLHVSGRAAFHLHSIIVPLLIPDLPVVVWWTGPLPAESHLIEELCGLADHFVVDSSRFTDLGDLSRMREVAALHDCAIGDLNYERLRSWRDLVERHTGAGGLGEWISSVKSAEIRFRQQAKQTPAQAILFLAWLAVHCGWELDSATAGGSNRLTLRQDKREIPVYLEPVKYEGVDRGWLVSIKLAFERDGETALLSVSRTGDPLLITVRTELPDGVREEHVRIEACDSQTVLMHQLDTAPHDPEFVRLLIAAAPLIQAARA